MPKTKQPEQDYSAGSEAVQPPSLVRRLLSNSLFSLLFQVCLAIIPAFCFWMMVDDGYVGDRIFRNTGLFLTLAVVVVWFVMSRLRSYAKSRLLSYHFPVNFLVYSGILSVIAIFRLDYSAYQYVFGAIGGVTASFLTTVVLRTAQKLQYVVPGGRTNELRLGGQYTMAPSLIEVQSLVEAHRLGGSIVADLHHDHSPDWERLFAKASLAGIPVYHYRQVAEMQTGQVKISHLSENDLGSLIPNAPYMTTKRLIDLIGSLLLLPFCLIAFAFIALLIKVDSPGSVFFVQERVGFRGEAFKMVKFRTMRERASIEDENARRVDAMTKADDDRITGIGTFLRKTRLDELPQILNVLKGEMSWIGPRPEAKSLSDWYERELPFYSYRHIVRPGITGWAQVNQGHVTGVDDVNAKLRFDFYYVKNISLWLDFLIVLKTFRVIFTGSGAK